MFDKDYFLHGLAMQVAECFNSADVRLPFKQIADICNHAMISKQQ